MNKLLTIAIPTYNRANLLDKQLSWLAQAIQGFESDCELFISDNCSTDHTQDVINKWQAILIDIPFTNNKNTENIGLRKNIAHCINSAKTKYVWTVGDDDPIQQSAVNYVVTKLRQNGDLSLLFLNFYGRDQITGQPLNPTTTIGDRWFDADSEDGRGDGKAIFEHCLSRSVGAVLFITASVYRTDWAQQALQNWKNATDNWSFLAYVAGYCASKGSVIVTKDTYIECVIGVSYWQQEPTTLLLWRYKHTPNILMKLKEIGYSQELCNGMLFQNFKETSLSFLLDAFRKWPVLTVRTVIYFLFIESLAAWEMKTFKDHLLFVYRKFSCPGNEDF
jgi:glycosyltransferase involved in cell wall biosynthesis